MVAGWLATVVLCADYGRVALGESGADWTAVGGDRGGMRYSTLDQIDRANVGGLTLAWRFSTKEKKQKTIECTPVVVEGVLYLTTANLRVVAIHAGTGTEIWSFDPFEHESAKSPLASGGVNRGVAYWSDGEADGARRIFLGAADGRLTALDARTGKPDAEFSNGGVKDLREDFEPTLDGRDIYRLPYGPTSAPAVFGDLVILGFSCGEGPGTTMPGDVRAFDARSGEEKWRFHTVPRPGEFGNETWGGESWRNRGAANAWGGITVDETRGMVFFGLGSAAYDFFGGDRPGDNLFANSTVALDATTGERRWHFQTLHHDVWDHDLPTYPNLVSVTVDGKRVDAAAQVTKTGYVFLFNRETGEPLFEVQEREVPESTIDGEAASQTQPVPVRPPPITMIGFTEEDITDIGPTNRAAVRKQLEKLRYGEAYEPPSLEGTVLAPGFHGGATWSGASFDPVTETLYVNSNNVPNVITLKKASEDAVYAYGHLGYPRLLDHEGYPGVKPPWGLLTAVDLRRGTFRWQVPLGEFEELTARGIPPTGTENFGGTIVTAGGLVFIAGTMDERFRAFDKETGEVLWEYQLPAGGYATPCTYAADGRQYVVIACGGGGKLGTPAGNEFFAFALPD